MISVLPADSPARLAVARILFDEYATTPGVGECVEEFAAEVTSLPGRYAPPAGALLLAFDGEVPVGCVALRPLEPPAICEMKRLYVRPDARGRRVAERLVCALVSQARDAGYSAMRLDTLPSLQAAQALYRRLGFRLIAPYSREPIPGAVHFELVFADATL